MKHPRTSKTEWNITDRMEHQMQNGASETRTKWNIKYKDRIEHQRHNGTSKNVKDRMEH